MANLKPDLIIVGASARAAAESAWRAGLKPWTADLFGDTDLWAICPGVVIARSDYPHRLPEILDQWDASIPCTYTGALENHPEIIRRIAEQRPLWGNGSEAVCGARDPFALARVLRAAGLSVPEARTIADPPADAAVWLVKPIASAGGRGIAPSPPAPLPQGARGENGYFQRFVRGESLSAAYIADGGSAHLLGITRQLVGESWLHAKPFHYCGSIGPLRLPEAVQAQFHRQGELLTQEFGLRGLFGIDAMMEDSTVWFIEINPRYTASMEVIELARGVSLVAEHARVFGWGGEVRRCESNERMVGKAILFAGADLVAPARIEPRRTQGTRSGFTRFADIPQPGSGIRKGEPILTILTTGVDEADCFDSLRRAAAELDHYLHRR